VAREYNVESSLVKSLELQAKMSVILKAWVIALFIFLCTPLSKEFSFWGYFIFAGALPAALFYQLQIWLDLNK